jgi:hypothetical protein
MTVDRVRAVADAVLYEGYLLYPYRATSGKNQLRWQFGVLGPQGAEEAGTGEGSSLSMQCLTRSVGSRPEPVQSRPEPGEGSIRPSFDKISTREVGITITVRFLQLQQRRTQVVDDHGGFVEVPELRVDGDRWFAWDEAIEIERSRTLDVDQLIDGHNWDICAESGEDVELIHDHQGRLAGRLVRERWRVRAAATARLEPIGAYFRLTVGLDNAAAAGDQTQDEVLRRSLIGTHLIIEAATPAVEFVSVIEPPTEAVEAAATCHQHRCWPVLAGPEGSTDTVLGSPIILYDHPQIAAESTGALFDSTEIDEILTLRVMTMTETEKAEARATDPRAAEIIDRCDTLSPDDLQRLHGVLRSPSLSDEDPFRTFNHHDPETHTVLIMGETVGKNSVVRINPQRRADAQDLFYADQLARVTAVHRDFDGETHVAVVLLDDPAAELHDWYGRYLYFSPDEVIPVQISRNEGR